jgi:adenosine deaminase
MCKSSLHPLLSVLPKCEHHTHLEGCLDPPLLFRLSAANSISLPSTDSAFASPNALLERYSRFTSLADFLHYYFIGMSVLLHASDFEALAWSYFTTAHAQGVIHAEVFFDPQAHTSRGVAYSTVVEGFTAACRRVEKELGMSTLLIVCFLRHLPVSDAEKTFETALPDLKSGLISGIGLDSNEVGFPPSLFKGIYTRAQQEGIHRTAHAGEEGPAAYVWEGLKELALQRVDHGIRLVDDAELVKTVARNKTLVTMCPVSNLKLQCVTAIRDLPIRTFLDHGVSFSLNGDDPAYFGAYCGEVYCAVQEAFDLSISEWKTVIVNGIEGSWCSEERKEEIKDKLEDVLGRWNRGD